MYDADTDTDADADADATVFHRRLFVTRSAGMFDRYRWQSSGSGMPRPKQAEPICYYMQGTLAKRSVRLIIDCVL